MLAAFISSLNTVPGESRSVDIFLNSISLLFSSLVTGGVAGIEVGNGRCFADYKGEKEVKPWYIPYFLARSLLISLVFHILQGDGRMYSVGITQVLYLCGLLLVRPYSSALHNMGVLLCEFTIFLSIGLAFLDCFFNIPEMIEVLLIFVLEGALIVCLLVSVIRLGVAYYRILTKQLRKEPNIQVAGQANPTLKANNLSELAPTLHTTLMQKLRKGHINNIG
jgi:hypothetical protein